MNAYTINASCTTHKGHLRNINEDNLIFDQFILKENHDLLPEELTIKCGTIFPSLYGIFDGMGGHSKGQRASYLTAKKAGELFLWERLEEEAVVKLLRDICIDANREICFEMEREKDRIGTTAAMLYVQDEQAWVCNIGDSPVFRVRNGFLESVYEEHTERMIREKIMGKEACKGKKFPLLQHIGIFPHELEICPYIKRMNLEPGDQFLLCSDGLTDMVPENQILRIMNAPVSVEEKVRTLKDVALQNGGKDNVSIIILAVARRDGMRSYIGKKRTLVPELIDTRAWKKRNLWQKIWRRIKAELTGLLYEE